MSVGNKGTRHHELVYYRNDSIFEKSNDKFHFVINNEKHLITKEEKGNKYFYIGRFDNYLRSISAKGVVDSSYRQCGKNFLFWIEVTIYGPRY